MDFDNQHPIIHLSVTMIRLPLPHVLGLTVLLASNAHAADTPKGQTYFELNCASCHSVDAARTAGAGPGLHGVVGGAVGAAPGYNYSAASRQAKALGTVWSTQLLDAFLADPQKVLPGNAMPLTVPSAADRANVVAYLAKLSSNNAQPNAAQPAAPAIDSAGTEDWRADKPGRVHHFTAADMPAPYATPSKANSPSFIRPADGMVPQVPKGFQVNPFARNIFPRYLAVAPNGDVFVADSAKGQIKVLRSADQQTASSVSVFADGLTTPFGMVFYPHGPNPTHVYVASVTSVVRYPYRAGDLTASGPAQTIVPTITAAAGGHVTRTLALTPDNQRLLLSVGSATNVATGAAMSGTPNQGLAEWERTQGVGATWGAEEGRAAVYSFKPDGSDRQAFAHGLRNCVGLTIHPQTQDLWCTVNERDGLGDDLPPDYVTRVPKGSFFGWPWYYIGAHEDPRHAGKRPDLKDKVTVPDVLLQAHSAPLGMVVYRARPGAANAFPKTYEGDMFVALHGSWNRATRTGTKVIRIPLKGGVPNGRYEDFMTGFIVNNSSVWGRPASVAVAADGALLVGDGAGKTVWRIAPSSPRK